MASVVERTLFVKRESGCFQLPSEFRAYLPDLSSRFHRALQQPPMGILYQEGVGWHPQFKANLKAVDAVCTREGICGHGLENHLLYVAQNAFALANAIPSQKKDESIITDGNLTFVSLTHDIGYAQEGVVWQNKEAQNHELESAYWIGRHRRNNNHPQFFPEEHIASFDRTYFPYFFYTILANADHNGDFTRLTDSIAETPTPFGIFMLTMFLSDKLDFFRTERVQTERVVRPRRYEENPYFFLADAVGGYEIISDESSVYYTVRIKNNYSVITADGSQQDVDFEWWQSQVNTHYGWIPKLGKAFGKAVGKTFLVVEKNSHGTDGH